MPLALQAFGLGQVAHGLKALFIPPFLPEEAIGFFLPYIILVTPDCRGFSIIEMNEPTFTFLVDADSVKVLDCQPKKLNSLSSFNQYIYSLPTCTVFAVVHTWAIALCSFSRMIGRTVSRGKSHGLAPLQA